MTKFAYSKPTVTEITDEELNSISAAVSSSTPPVTGATYGEQIMENSGFGADSHIDILLPQFIAAINKYFPDKSNMYKAWLFFRMISGFCYSGDLANKIAWDQVAGKLPYSLNDGYAIVSGEKLYFTQTLGMTELKYRLLRYMVRLQHQLCSYAGFYEAFEKSGSPYTVDGAWDSFCLALGPYAKGLTSGALSGAEVSEANFKSYLKALTKGMFGGSDFSHMCVTVASGLATHLGLAGGSGSAISTFFDSAYKRLCAEIGADKAREYMAGWLGDAALADPGETISFGVDDYKSDIDALAITYYLRAGYDTSTAILFGFDIIDRMTRREFFLTNVGGLEKATTLMKLAIYPTMTNSEWVSYVSKASFYTDTYKFYQKISAQISEY